MAADKMCTNGHFSSAKNAGRTCWCGAVIVGFAAALMAAQVEHRVTPPIDADAGRVLLQGGPAGDVGMSTNEGMDPNETAWAAAMQQWSAVVDDFEEAAAEQLRRAHQVSAAELAAAQAPRRPSRAAQLSEVGMWVAIVAVIGGGIALRLDPVACAVVLLVVVAGLYFLGRPR